MEYTERAGGWVIHFAFFLISFYFGFIKK